MFKKMSKAEKIIFIFVILLFIGIGMVLSVPGIIRALKCDATTKAIVVSTDTYTYMDQDTRMEVEASRPTVAYEVNGVHYENSWGEYSNIDDIYEGQKVDIRYDSKDPNTYVLARWYGLEPRNFIGIFIIFITIAMIFKVKEYYKGKR